MSEGMTNIEEILRCNTIFYKMVVGMELTDQEWAIISYSPHGLGQQGNISAAMARGHVDQFREKK